MELGRRVMWGRLHDKKPSPSSQAIDAIQIRVASRLEISRKHGAQRASNEEQG